MKKYNMDDHKISEELKQDRNETWELLAEGNFTFDQQMVLLALYFKLRAMHHDTIAEVSKRHRKYILRNAIAWMVVVVLAILEMILRYLV